MSTVKDYLTKQIYIDKNVVTFRSLSRQFGIHVNVAKNELAQFHTNSVNAHPRSFATYVISGELFPQPNSKQKSSSQQEDAMEVDSELPEDDHVEDSEEDVPLTTMTLVGEGDLEHAKTRYARIFSTHVYCLSTSSLTDAGLICDPSAVVYAADTKDRSASSIVLGRVVGPDVRTGKASAPVASSSKATDPLSRKPTLTVKTKEKPAPVEAPKKGKEKDKEKPTTLKHKPSGKLDWSKAKKSSDNNRSKEKEQDDSQSLIPNVKAEKAAAKLERDESPKDDSKRGTKRKAAPPPVSDTDEIPKGKRKGTPTPSSKDVKLRKNRIISDDEDEAAAEKPLPKPKAKGKSRVSMSIDVLDSEQERSLRAMMDMDDSQVEMASSTRPPPKPAPQAPKDEDVEMVSEPEPEAEQQTRPDDDMEEDALKPKPRKRKEKKVVPVGQNGLKKKRVMKSRMTVDAKGYMVTEDYSEYESVDEEEIEKEKEVKKKPQGKKATAASSAAKAKKGGGSDDETPSKPKPVARTSSAKGRSNGAKAGGQGNLKDFFGKPK